MALESHRHWNYFFLWKYYRLFPWIFSQPYLKYWLESLSSTPFHVLCVVDFSFSLIFSISCCVQCLWFLFILLSALFPSFTNIKFKFILFSPAPTATDVFVFYTIDNFPMLFLIFDIILFFNQFVVCSSVSNHP